MNVAYWSGIQNGANATIWQLSARGQCCCRPYYRSAAIQPGKFVSPEIAYPEPKIGRMPKYPKPTQQPEGIRVV